MKKLLLSAFALCFAGTIAAQEAPLWMRYCALSPDGTTIAFTYKGDIYTVPSTGGRATQITTNPAFDTTPVWSPDGKQIAFASDRMGSLDVFVVAKEGGVPQRLTTHSGSEKPVAYKGDNSSRYTKWPLQEDVPPCFHPCLWSVSLLIRKELCFIRIKKDMKTTGVNIRYPLSPVTSGAILPERRPYTRSKPLSEVKTVNRYGLPTVSHSII